MSAVLPSPHPVSALEGYKPGNIDDALLALSHPVILRGFGNEWPLVQAGKTSGQKALEYLADFYSGMPLTTCYGDAADKGRIFYNSDMSGFNFVSKRELLPIFVQELLAQQFNVNAPTLYIPSTDTTQWFPGLAQENNAGLDALNPIKLLWAGNRSRIAAHYDFPNNLACCVTGRRRFTLFPPEQVANLYPGPLEFAPGGQEISLVDFAAPDLERFPRFPEAMANALVAELEAGDALLLPGMWWHHVEGLDPINILYTHWWRESPAYLGRPTNSLLHAVMSLRNLSYEQRQAWKNLFNYYVFDRDETDLRNIPEHARAMLELPMAELDARKLRADLLKRLNI